MRNYAEIYFYTMVEDFEIAFEALNRRSKRDTFSYTILINPFF